MGSQRANLVLQFIGPFAVTIGGLPLPSLRTHKGRWLLALLALRAGKPVERVWLAETLWPDSAESQALYNLRRSLSDLRNALGAEEVRLETPTAHTLLLNLDDTDFDVAEFDLAFTGNTSIPLLERAVALYRGPLLEGCQESWVFAERSARQDKYLMALERLTAVARQRGDFQIAIDYSRRILEHDPLREEALRNLMQTLVDMGDIAAALEAYRSHKRLFLEKYRATLSPQTQALADKLSKEMGKKSTDPKFPPLPVTDPPFDIPTISGALPPDSPFYVERAADPVFYEALRRRDSIVLIKGPRQIGKTSLLARGLKRARQMGAQVAITDFQKLPREALESAGAFFATLAGQLTYQLNLSATPTAEFGWRPTIAPNENFERFLRRHILAALPVHLVWALDEVDRLFGHNYSNDVFALFRAWHNERALDPDGPWQRLTLTLSYATEAHLFVTDMNQSPFNVGTRLELIDFTRSEIQDLNQRYDNPLTSEEEIARFYRLMGGHPYLVQEGFLALVRKEMNLARLEATGETLESKTLADHLRRIHTLLEREPVLSDAVRSLLSQGKEPPLDIFYRLRTAGILLGDAPMTARFRCGLYEQYLRAFL